MQQKWFKKGSFRIAIAGLPQKRKNLLYKPNLLPTKGIRKRKTMKAQSQQEKGKIKIREE